MQSKHFAAAPASLTRFMTGTVAALALAVSLLANVALGGVALHTSGHLPSFGDSQPRHAALQATYVEGQGEGLLGPALPAAAPRALPNTNPYEGEGRLNVARSVAPTLLAHDQPYMGEGRLNVRRQSALPNAVAGCGQDEALLQNSIAAENLCH